MPACATQLGVMKGLLDDYATSTGLRINYSKSMLVPINLTAERTQSLAHGIGCIARKLPFTYLGLPLGTTHY
jgi:hypothetical protein